ncbi:MAG: discoidin domain-containing protein, partial [Candidatus Schekmanbacteria bacterium]|nr:discoidin domain-containing protein [Candidatus Schekmanbacteria bacterium]
MRSRADCNVICPVPGASGGAVCCPAPRRGARSRTGDGSRRREASSGTRRRAPISGAALVTVVALLGGSASAGASTPPPLPSSFFGVVTVAGGTVPAGVAVAAWSAAGVEAAQTAVRLVDGEAVYALDVPGDVAGTPAAEGAAPGEALAFRIGTTAAVETAFWAGGTVARRDLALASGIDLAVAIDDGQAAMLPGDATAYRITVSNGGYAPATGVALSAAISAAGAVLSASDGGAIGGGAVSWSAFELAAGAAVTREVVVAARGNAAVGEVLSVAVSAADDGAHGLDPTPEDNAATDENAIAALIADAGGPYSAVEGLRVVLEGTGSRALSGGIASYAWDLDGDGAFGDASGATAEITPADDGELAVGLRVAAASGEVATDIARVTVANAAPAVWPGARALAAVGLPVALSGWRFSDPGVFDTHTATVDWGDGEVAVGEVSEAGGEGSVDASHAYAAAGEYAVTVCVVDDAGAEGCGEGLVEVVDDLPPVAAFLPAKGRDLAFSRDGAKVEARSSERPGYTAERALDGDPVTRWLTAAGQAADQWFTLDLAGEEPQVIDRVSLETDGSAEGVRDFEIRVTAAAAPDGAFTPVLAGTLA